MNSLKRLLLLLIIFSLLSCSNQQDSISQATLTASTITTESNPITSFLDFDHPRLHEIAGNNPLIIREITRTRRYFDGTPYVAIVIDTGDPVFKVKMLIFRLEKPNASLIYESDPHYYISFDLAEEDPSWLIENSSYYYNRSIVGGIYPIDENYIIVPFHISDGGNCYDCSGMRIIGISEDEIVKDITPVVPFTSKTFFDINGNGEFEIVATQYYESDYGAISRAGSPYAFRLYAWNGKEYVDVSKDEKDFFDKKITEIVNELKNTYGAPLKSNIVMPLLSQIFFNYESSGRTEYGWKQIQELGDLKHWDIQNTPLEEIQSYHEVFKLLEERKNGTIPIP